MKRTKSAVVAGMAVLSSLAAFGMVELPFAENAVVQEKVTTVAGKEPSLLPPGKTWKLVWHDEFDQKEIDRTKWMCRESFWGFDFPAFSHGYEGLEMTGETVKMKLCRRGEKDFSSPHLQTGSLTYDIPRETSVRKAFWPFGPRRAPTFMHKYGYYEVRCRNNRHWGWHAAFWIQAPGVGSHPDPAAGGTEVDILETWKFFQRDPASRGRIVAGVIAGGYGSDTQSFSHYQWHQPDADTGWHVYGLDWSPDGYSFYCDGKKIGEQNYPVSHVEEFVMLTTEPGGYRRFGADGGLSAEGSAGSRRALEGALAVGDFFEVDYVRVYDDAKGYGAPKVPLARERVYAPFRPGEPCAAATNLLVEANRLAVLPRAALRRATDEEALRRMDAAAEKLLDGPTRQMNWMQSVRSSCALRLEELRAPAR